MAYEPQSQIFMTVMLGEVMQSLAIYNESLPMQSVVQTFPMLNRKMFRCAPEHATHGSCLNH
jgi:hypothetical protein